MSSTRKALATAAALAVALSLASCAAAGPSGSAPSDRAPTAPVGWDAELDFGVPGDVVLARHDAEFYPACGNETLTWDGTVYYPYNPTRLDDFPDPAGVVTGASALENLPAPGWARMSAPLPAIPMPEPGDDTGTLVIYEDGHAYWQSVNQALDTWLTTTEIEYNWIC